MGKKSTTDQTIDPASATKPELLKYVKDPIRTMAELQAAIGRFPECDRVIARREDVPAELLEKLSHSSDKATREAVAGNLNVLPQVLVKLGQQFPKAFLENPALDLILIETPALLTGCDPTLLVQIAKRPECPASYLNWAAGQGDEKVQLAVAMNPDAPAALLNKLAQSPHQTVQVAVAAHRSRGEQTLPEDLECCFREAVVERIGALTIPESNDMWEKKELGLPQFPRLPLHVRQSLAESSNVGADSLSRLHAKLGPLLAERLAVDVAEDPSTPPEVLEVLAKFADRDVRNNVALNPAAPAEVLELLSCDDMTRRRVAENWNASVSLLTALSQDADSVVKSRVAANPRTPHAVLAKLAKSTEAGCRIGVAYNPATPLDVLQILAKDPENKVATCSQDRLKNLEIYRKRHEAGLSSTPPDVLEMLARDTDTAVRQNVACNPNTPTATLETLSKDSDDYVRQGIAFNPNTQVTIRVAVLAALVTCSDREIRRKVASNLNTPATTLKILAKAAAMRQVVAANPNTHAVILETLAQDSDGNVRRNVAMNSNTPSSVLETLTNDADIAVRYSAAGNPNTPAALQEAIFSLLAKEKPAIRFQAIVSSALPREMVINTLNDPAMVKHIPKLYLPSDILEALSQSDTEEVRTAALVNSNHPQWQGSLRSAPKNNPWFIEQLGKSTKEIQEAVAQDNILFFSGKDPDKTALSQRPVGVILALADGVKVAPERIARVSKSTDWLVRMAVARNLGTPPNILQRMTKDAHHLVAAQAERTLQRLNGESLPTENAIEFERPPVLNEIARRIRTSKEYIVSPFDPLWGSACALNVVWIPALAEQLVMAWGKDALSVFTEDMRSEVARNPDLSPVVLEVLAKDKKPSVRERVARNPNTPVPVLEALANDKKVEVRIFVGLNQNTPLPVLEILVKDSDERVRRGVAVNPNTPYLVVELWARGQGHEGLKILAKNITTPVLVLEELARDKDSNVRREVAENPKSSASILDLLAKDEDSDVRRGVTKNPNAPVTLLEVLVKDADARVRREVAENPNSSTSILDLLAKDEDRDVRRGVAKNLNAPVNLLEVLAKDENEWVRRVVSENPKASASILDLLARDEDWVRIGVAKNPNTPVTVAIEILLMSLANQKKLFRIYEALATLLSHPGYTGPSYPDLVRRALEPPVPPQHATDADILRALTGLGCLPAQPTNKELTAASRSKDWLTRLAVCLHPAATEAQLKLLAADTDANTAAASQRALAGRQL